MMFVLIVSLLAFAGLLIYALGRAEDKLLQQEREDYLQGRVRVGIDRREP